MVGDPKIIELTFMYERRKNQFRQHKRQRTLSLVGLTITGLLPKLLPVIPFKENNNTHFNVMEYVVF